jgi:uncharacterized protein YjbI with pentapeptide repeats
MFWLWFAAIAISVLVAVLGIWWWFPKWQIERLRPGIPDPKGRAEIEDNFRKSLGQLIAGAVVILGASLAYYGSHQTLRSQNEDAEKRIISEHIVKGFEALSSKDLVVRLGGVYLLQRVNSNQVMEYPGAVLDGLSTFVRESSQGVADNQDPLRGDIQAALTIIKMRKSPEGELKLTHARIPYADLNNANFKGADLRGAYMNHARLQGARLDGVDLSGDAHLEHADLFNAKMIDAKLSGAKMDHAQLIKVTLTKAVLTNAILTNAKLDRALLDEADLNGANLSGAHLDAADLSHARNLKPDQLRGACGTGTKLPTDLQMQPLPPCQPETP